MAATFRIEKINRLSYMVVFNEENYAVDTFRRVKGVFRTKSGKALSEYGFAI